MKRFEIMTFPTRQFHIYRDPTGYWSLALGKRSVIWNRDKPTTMLWWPKPKNR